MNDPIVTFVADSRRARLYRMMQSPEDYIWEDKTRFSADYERPYLCPAPCTGTLSASELYGVTGRGITRSALFIVPQAERVTVRVKAGSSTNFALGLTAALTGAVAIIPGFAMTLMGGDTLAPGLVTLGVGIALLPIGLYLANKGVTHVTVTAEPTPRLQRPTLTTTTDAKPSPADVLLIFPRIETTDALSADQGRTLRLALQQTPINIVNHTPTGRSLGTIRTPDINVTSVDTHNKVRCGFGRQWSTGGDLVGVTSYMLPAFCDERYDPTECRESTTRIIDSALDQLRIATANAGGWVASDIRCWSGKNSFGDGRIWCEATVEGPE